MSLFGTPCHIYPVLCGKMVVRQLDQDNIEAWYVAFEPILFLCNSEYVGQRAFRQHIFDSSAIGTIFGLLLK